jgi:iron(III) transport system substrate-binding protein
VSLIERIGPKKTREKIRHIREAEMTKHGNLISWRTALFSWRMRTVRTFIFAVAAAVTWAATGPTAKAVQLPPATWQILKGLKLDPSVLGDIDRALNVPIALLNAARKEGHVKVGSSIDAERFMEMVKPFRERYPFIKISYARGNRYTRVIKPLIGLQAGRVTTDVIAALGNQYDAFKKTGALADLRGLPAYQSLDPEMMSPGGLWAGQGMLIRCMAYNTKLVKPKDLPKTWGDLVTNPRWRGGKIGMPNRPDAWALHLWATKGEAWTRDFLTRLFTVVKPSLRKEGSNATLALMVAGEFDAVLTGSTRRGRQYIAKKAPFAMICPGIVPVGLSDVAVIRISPRFNAAMLYANWLISREGQLAQYARTGYGPTYRNLREKGLLPLAEITKGRKIVIGNYAMQTKYRDKLGKFWDQLWYKRAGLKLRTVKARITQSKRGGRKYAFEVGGKPQEVGVSSSRTVILIDGKRQGRKAVKKGMMCAITYPGNGQEAKRVACDK